MATYLIEVSLINGQKIAFEDDFIDEVHVATALKYSTQEEWYFYKNASGSGAFIRDHIVEFVAYRR